MSVAGDSDLDSGFEAWVRETGRGDGLAKQLEEAQARVDKLETAQAELEEEKRGLENQVRQLNQEVLVLRIEQAGEKQPAGKEFRVSLKTRLLGNFVCWTKLSRKDGDKRASV